MALINDNSIVMHFKLITIQFTKMAKFVNPMRQVAPYVKRTPRAK